MIPRHRTGSALLLAATLLIGIGWILVLPPFEGFDETMHYSSIREIADNHAIPGYGRSRIATVVERYGLQGPLPCTQQHGVTLERPISYREFATDDAARVAFMRDFAEPQALPRRFEPGSSLNWQAQHAPLYYLTLAPFMRATDGLSLVSQVMVLRVVSWLMALAGLAIGVWGTARAILAWSGTASGPIRPDDALSALPVACLAYPLFVPMFFPEFARLGNDSLCLLLFGASWALILAMLGRRPSAQRAVALGVCLGAGLLTKAFFIPISAGAVGCLAWSAWRAHSPGADRRLALRDTAIAAAAALAIGGWWYAMAYLQHGAVTGSNDVIAVDRDGGLLAGLREHFAWRHVGRGIAAFIVTWYFAGTWSLVRLPEWMYVPGLIAVALMGIAAFRAPRDIRVTRLVTTMLWMLLPMLAGFGYHLLIRIAGGAEGHGTAGWYVNILAPACGVPLAAGMIAIASVRKRAWIAGAMWAWMVAFAAAAFWIHAALYAGTAVKDPQTRHVAFPDGWLSLFDVVEIHGRLAAFGWPTASILCVCAGAQIALAVGLRK